MKRITSLIAVATVTSAVVLVGGAGPVGSQPPSERQTVTIFDPETSGFERFINRGKRGISTGDTILFVDPQLDPETCERIGNVTGRIQVIRSIGREDALFIGDFTLTLDDGKVTAGGAARFSEFEGGAPVFAVTGGTQTYRDASGEVSFTENTTLCGVRGALATIDVGPTR